MAPDGSTSTQQTPPAAATEAAGAPAARRQFASLAEFWPYYLGEHRHPVNRALHFVGTTGVLVWIGLAIAWRQPWLVAAAPLTGYGMAWIGHFGFEKNKPATFGQPLRSFVCDWIMYGYMLTGRLGRELARLDPPGR